MLCKTLLPVALASVAAAQTLGQALLANNNTSMLAAILGQVPSLVANLGNSTGNLTLLAPSDSALNALLQSPGGQALASNQNALSALLSYHVLQGSFPASAFNSTPVLARTELIGNNSYARVSGGQRVEAQAVNGSVYIYSGFDNNSTVTQANIAFERGLIHVINKVLTLPPDATTALLAANLTALYGAAASFNLADTINGLSDVTIFAPNNAAFQSVGDVNAITPAVLEYHIVQGSQPYYSTQLTNGTSLKTLNGANVVITRTANNTFVNGARVIRSNVLISGGVVHVIDNVLNPNPVVSSTTVALATATSGIPGFLGATTFPYVPFTSGVPVATTTLAVGPATSTATAVVGTTALTAGAMPMATGAIGAAALFGAGAWVLNL